MTCEIRRQSASAALALAAKDPAVLSHLFCKLKKHILLRPERRLAET